jgi:hypothetical protein
MFRAGRERSEELEKRRREGGIPIRPRAARCEDTAFVPARQCPSVGRMVEVVIMVVLVTRVRAPQFPLCDQNRNICLVCVHMEECVVEGDSYNASYFTSLSSRRCCWNYETKSGASYPNVVASCHSYIHPAAEPCVRVQYSSSGCSASLPWIPRSLAFHSWGTCGVGCQRKSGGVSCASGVRAGKLRRVVNI